MNHANGPAARPARSPRGRRAKRLAAGLATALAAGALSACSKSPSALDPKGPQAGSLATLWWWLLGVGTIVWVIVMVALLLALFRRRRHVPEPGEQLPDAQRFVLIAGGIIPAIILIGFIFGISHTLRGVTKAGTPEDLQVEIIGHDWWWEVRYPQYNFVTANELHIPVGKPVNLILSSADVIHSFWTPQLQGKMDLIPGQTNNLWVQANEAGEYRGQCAEYCGLQHAHMALYVIAEPPEKLNAWVSEQQKPAAPPADAKALEGQQVFQGSACVYCHAVSGTNATGTLGPDLTHLASRGFLGAGVIENTPSNLKQWVRDSQQFKPGNAMPPLNLSPDALDALLTYLEGLK